MQIGIKGRATFFAPRWKPFSHEIVTELSVLMMKQEAYKNTVLAHKDRVYSYATYLLSDREEGLDVAQEAFVRLWQHRDRIPAGGGAARAWLLRTAHNLCMDRLRLRRTRPQVDPKLLELLPAADVQCSPQRRQEGRELHTSIMNALAQLSPRDRAVVVLREMHGLSYEELSRSLDLPLGTLKAVLHRARGRLRNHLLAAGVTP